MEKIRVLLVDDHLLFRQGVASILQRAGERFHIVGEASDGAQAQTLARTLKPDVILLDVQMPNCDGLQAARAIAAKLPEIKIVMLTVSEREEDLFEAIKAGARGYLLKTTASTQEITTALENVMAGQVMLTPIMATKLVSEFAAIARAQKNEALPRAPESADAPHLTEREREVLNWVAQGKTNKEIATELHVAENTVRAHLRNILDKLQVHNRTQAAAFARRDHA